MTNYGHIREDGSIQPLEDHLRGTAKLAEEFTSSIGLNDVGSTIGLLHDLGKASDDFGRYILGQSEFSRGELDHSTAGAQFIHTRDAPLKQGDIVLNSARQMMELSIVSHHSGMIDCLSSEGCDIFRRRMEKDGASTHIDECVESISSSILEEVMFHLPGAEASLSDKIAEILTSARGEGVRDGGVMRLGLLARFILSCLIDADRIDTTSFMDRSTRVRHHPDWDLLAARLENHLSMLGDEDRISMIRRRISDRCREVSAADRGVFRLSVPTGGGKTLASLRFALNHAREHGMDRILYIAPYTTILEQNAAVVRGVLEREGEDDIVLECHSNVDVQDDGNYSWSCVSDSWDQPVIFTTMVQFLETLYSSGTKRVRRMHNLANSIIIFDEVQAVPVKTVHLFNEAINFLTGACGSSVVLCTATQPLLDRGLEYVIHGGIDIVTDESELSEDLRRTEITVMDGGRIYGTDEICRLAGDIIGECDSLLIVVNTKRMAREVYSGLKELAVGARIYHLSTDMCPVHRKKVLDAVVSGLGSSKIICVSTQLIEAGVDVDFNSVIRCMAGLDSIVQAAGRCNRNGLMDHKGRVYVVKTGEDLGMLPEILEGRRCTEQIIAEGYGDLLSVEAMRRYFEIYFYRRREDMSYRIGKSETTLFDMLSKNASAVRLYRSRNNRSDPPEVLRQSFAEANSMFHVIDARDSVIVPYDDTARAAISVLSSDVPASEKMRALRTVQRYSVNTFALSSMVSSGMVFEIAPESGLYCLAEGYYDEEYGIRKESAGIVLLF